METFKSKITQSAVNLGKKEKERKWRIFKVILSALRDVRMV